MKAITVQVVLLLGIIAFFRDVPLAQEIGERCKAPSHYENRNQVDYGPLSVRVVSGRVLAEVGNPVHELGPSSGSMHELIQSSGNPSNRLAFRPIAHHHTAREQIEIAILQWAVGFVYDNNSNLITKTDPRNITCTCTFSYDAMNRMGRLLSLNAQSE